MFAERGREMNTKENRGMVQDQGEYERFIENTYNKSIQFHPVCEGQISAEIRRKSPSSDFHS